MLSMFEDAKTESKKFQKDKIENTNPNSVRIINAEGEEAPFYHLFLKTGEGVAENPRTARSKASHFINNYPELVLECSGKTAEEALQILAKTEEE